MFEILGFIAFFFHLLGCKIYQESKRIFFEIFRIKYVKIPSHHSFAVDEYRRVKK